MFRSYASRRVFAASAWRLPRIARPALGSGAPGCVLLAAAALWAAQPLSKRRAALAQTAPAALTPVQIMDVTNMVLEKVSIPMVPQTIQETVMHDAVQAVANAMTGKLSAEQVQKLGAAIDGVGDGISPAERQQIIFLLESSLESVPLIPKVTRNKIVTTIVDVIIGDASVLNMTSQTLAGGLLQGSNLFDPAARKKLAQRINEKVDIPGLSETQEEAIFVKGIDMLGDFLEKIVPPQYRKSLHACSPEEIVAFKQNVANQIEEKINIPMLPKEYKDKMTLTFVDHAFDLILDASGLDQVVLTPEIKLQKVEQHIEAAKVELETSKRTAKRREANCMRKVLALETQRKELRKEIRSHQHHFLIAGVLAAGVTVTGLICATLKK